MLSSKQIMMLKLLNRMVKNCNGCDLRSNGKFIPKWTEQSRYVIINESPNFSEIKENTPFLGPAGRILTRELDYYGFDPKDFLIINSVQCRPSIGIYNGKPSEMQLNCCKRFIRKYLKVLKPEKILCLGNYSKYIFTGSLYGVLRERGKFRNGDLGDGYLFPVLFTVSPGYCIYNEELGIELLKNDLKLFKETNFERIFDDWLLSEDDFKI